MKGQLRPCGLEFVLLYAIISVSFAITLASGAVDTRDAGQSDTDSHSVSDRRTTSTSSTTLPPLPLDVNSVIQPPVSNESTADHKGTNKPGNNTVALNTTNNYTKRLMESVKTNKGMLTRTLYVMIGITAIIVIYFGVRTLR